MARNIESGKIEEIIYARFEPGEDVLQALFEICVEKDIKTGIIMEGSGCVTQFCYQHFPKVPEQCNLPIEIATMHGPCEISLQGTIGTYICEDSSSPYYPPNQIPTIKGITENDRAKLNLAGTMGGHNTPYIHAHCTATNKDYTACGHLMPGTTIEVVGTDSKAPSHFTVVIAKVSGVVLENKVDELGGYHLVKKA